MEREVRWVRCGEVSRAIGANRLIRPDGTLTWIFEIILAGARFDALAYLVHEEAAEFLEQEFRIVSGNSVARFRHLDESEAGLGLLHPVADLFGQKIALAAF